MRTHKSLIITIAICAVATLSWGGYVDEDYTGASNGDSLDGEGQWSATSVIFSNNAIYFASSSAATNAVDATATKVWTDFDIRPALGAEPTSPATNTSSTLFYFNASSNIVVWHSGDNNWVTCSNDVWGSSVTAITNGTTNTISIYQNYANDEFALFLDSQCLIQDVPFPGDADGTTYNTIAIQNVDSNATVDNVYIQTTPTGDHSDNNNSALNSTADVTEMDSNGYVARTLYVDSGGTPSYSTLTAAVAIARNGDVINVAGSYTTTDENITIDGNGGELTSLTFQGNAFTCATFNVDSGVAVSLNENLKVTGNLSADDDITLANGKSLTVEGDATLDAGTLSATGAGNTLTVDGALTMTGTALIDLDDGTLTVDGALTMTGTALIDLDDGTLDNDAGTLSMESGTLIDVDNGNLYSASLDLEGTFDIDGGDWNTWGGSGSVAQTLPVNEQFTTYTAGNPITNYSFYGWTANSSSAVVSNSASGGSSGKVLYLPDGTIASNIIDSADGAIWTVYNLRPAPGAAPSDPDVTGMSFMSYISTNGYMYVNTNNAWVLCNELEGDGAPDTFDSSNFRKIAIYQNFGNGKFALFIESDEGYLELVKQEQPFPDTAATYSAFVVNNQDGDAYIDDISISYTTPSGGIDQDGDGVFDTIEIGNKGSIRPVDGTIFKFI